MNDMVAISESSAKIIRNKKKGKTIYKCPFCSYKGTKYNNVVHIEKHHPELIPEGYTAARLFFNHINKKTKGSCIMCGRETKWNENTWRYDRLCDSASCKKNYTNGMKKSMVDKYGKTTLLNDPKHQQKMLENRSISGDYKFKDGGVKQYVGSYEKNLLEYFDKVLNVPSKDVYTPGLTINYNYGGNSRFWITDMYYVPANLIIEVKDGGDNPNTREMPEYRAKQLAKEKALAKTKKYNYIRLTNNNFDEFVRTLDEIKDNMDGDDKEMVFNVLEATGLASVSGNAIASNRTIMVNNMVNNTVYNTGFTKDKTLRNIFYVGVDGKLDKRSITDINSDYVTSFTEDETISRNYDRIKELYENGDTIDFDTDYLYKMICEESILLNSNQPIFDQRFTRFVDSVKESTYHLDTESRKGLDDNLISESMDTFETGTYYNKINSILEGYEELNILSNVKGFIIYNEETNVSSEIFHSLDDITYSDLDRISGGI